MSTEIKKENPTSTDDAAFDQAFDLWQKRKVQNTSSQKMPKDSPLTIGSRYNASLSFAMQTGTTQRTPNP